MSGVAGRRTVSATETLDEPMEAVGVPGATWKRATFAPLVGAALFALATLFHQATSNTFVTGLSIPKTENYLAMALLTHLVVRIFNEKVPMPKVLRQLLSSLG